MTATESAGVPKSYFNFGRWCNQIIAISLVWIVGLVWFKFRIQGRDKIPKNTRFVMVANHNSNWDPPTVAMAVKWRPIAFMAKQELFAGGFSRWLHRALGAFAVNRQKLEKKTIKTALIVMRETDWTLCLFPEGTRHHDPDTLGEIKSGAVSLAKMGNLPILPIGMCKLGRHYSVVIGDLLPIPDDVETYNEQLKVRLLELKQQAKHAITNGK